MQVIQLSTAELDDVIDVLQQRRVEYVYSVESRVAYLYGTDDLVEQVDDILWARAAIQSIDFHQGAGVDYAMSVQNTGIYS